MGLLVMFFSMAITTTLVYTYPPDANGPLKKQYVMSPYSSLEEECAFLNEIVEHCHKGEGELMQYRTCVDRQVRVVKCQRPKTKCVEFYNVNEKTVAQCFDPRSRPSFPETGSISWNGTEVYDTSNSYRRPRERFSIISGRASKDISGNFYQIERKAYYTRFVLIKPYKNGIFAVYKAIELNQHSKYERGENYECTKTIVKSEGSLSSLWNSMEFKFYSRFYLEDSKQLDNGLRRQKWVEKIRSEEFQMDSRATWIMDYNPEKDIAVPVSSKFVYNDDDGRETTQKTYHYQRLEEDLSFKMPWYCK